MRGCVLETMGKAGRPYPNNKNEACKIATIKEQQVLRAIDRLSKLVWEPVVAVSAGKEYRGDDGRLIGSQLHLDDHLVHLSAVL